MIESSAITVATHDMERAVFHVTDVDAFYRRAVVEGLDPQTPPPSRRRMGRALLHITDPDGHELSFARPWVSQNWSHNGCVRRHPPDRCLPWHRGQSTLLGDLGIRCLRVSFRSQQEKSRRSSPLNEQVERQMWSFLD